MQAKPFAAGNGKSANVLNAVLAQRQRYVNPTSLNYLGSTLAYEVANAMVRCMVPPAQLIEVDVDRDGVETTTSRIKAFTLNSHLRVNRQMGLYGSHNDAEVPKKHLDDDHDHDPCRNLRGRWMPSLPPRYGSAADHDVFSADAKYQYARTLMGGASLGDRSTPPYALSSVSCWGFNSSILCSRVC